MVLTIDIGNTNVVVGCMDQDSIYFIERVSTDNKKTALEYAMILKTVFDLKNIKQDMIEGGIISSVVPPLTHVMIEAVEKVLGKTPMLVGPGIKTGLNIQMDNPNTVGSDLVVDAVAGVHEYGAPLIIVDLGTATTISVVDKNKNYIGGMIIPGMRVSMEALASGAAQLQRVSFEVPKKVIGTNTIDCMRSGLVLGSASCIDGLIDRIYAELGYEPKIVATGGLAKIIVPICKHDIILDDALLLKGLYLIYKRNEKEGKKGC